MKKIADDVIIREAVSSDADKIGELWITLMQEHEQLDSRFVLSDDAALRWQNDFPIWLEDRTRSIRVAECKGNVIGFIQAHRRIEPPIFKAEPEVYIDEIYVERASRGQGIGEQLLQATMAWAGNVGAGLIRLRVLSTNEEGIAFWEQHGAKKMDVTYTISLEKKPQTEEKERFRKLGF